jgi:glucosamine--fructose-6-phosphate aminotransferase (isomerizing)
MNSFYNEILQQPYTLRKLAEFYSQSQGITRLSTPSTPFVPILAGMGASFHAGWVATLYLHSLGLQAFAVETTDLLYYAASLLSKETCLVFVSQSGASGEVEPILRTLPHGLKLLAVTNRPESPLARHAQIVLPLLVNAETTVATQTYLNSLATLWLLGRTWAGIFDGSEANVLKAVADHVESLLETASASSARWLETLGHSKTLLFIGHGPHAATARQAAMNVSEWAKVPALSTSVGAFRHGFIEIAQPGLGVVIFAPPGRTHQSACALANELHDYGTRVLIVENGRTRSVDAAAYQGCEVEEFLSPILDIIPAQLFAHALAAQMNVAAGFRHISKVVTQL